MSDTSVATKVIQMFERFNEVKRLIMHLKYNFGNMTLTHGSYKLYYMCKPEGEYIWI